MPPRCRCHTSGKTRPPPVTFSWTLCQPVPACPARGKIVPAAPRWCRMAFLRASPAKRQESIEYGAIERWQRETSRSAGMGGTETNSRLARTVQHIPPPTHDGRWRRNDRPPGRRLVSPLTSPDDPGTPPGWTCPRSCPRDTFPRPATRRVRRPASFNSDQLPVVSGLPNQNKSCPRSRHLRFFNWLSSTGYWALATDRATGG